MVDYWVKIVYKYENELEEVLADNLMNAIPRCGMFNKYGGFGRASPLEVFDYDLKKKTISFDVKLKFEKPVFTPWSSCLLCTYERIPETKYCSDHQGMFVLNEKDIEDRRLETTKRNFKEDTELYENLLAQNIKQYVPENLSETGIDEDDSEVEVEFEFESCTIHTEELPLSKTARSIFS